LYKKDQLLCVNILEACNKILSLSNKFRNNLELEEDIVYFDAILMNFIVIGEMASKLSPEFKESCPEIEWRKIIAFRNFIAHDYFGIDSEEVWGIIKSKLPDLVKQLEIR
jgi:uncharacterized protein with HEPN domain